MDCRFYLSFCGNRKENAQNRTESLHNSTDFECDYCRENAYFTSAYRLRINKNKIRQLYPVEFIRLITGQ